MKQDAPATAPLPIVVRASSVTHSEDHPPDQQQPTSGPVNAFNPHHERLKIATLAFGISLFMNWGAAHWVLWYIEGYWDPMYYGYMSQSGVGEMLEWLDLMFVQAWLLDEYRFMLEVSGPFPLLFIVLRDLMPFVFVSMFVFAWSKKDGPSADVERIGAFSAAYAALMGVVGLYIIIQQSSAYGGFGVGFEIVVDSVGFWVAVFAGVFLHPKLIPLPDRFARGTKETSILDEEQLNSGFKPEALETEENAPERWVMVLYYLPLAYLWSVANSVSRGGNDDAFFFGIMIPIVVFLIGLSQFGWEFLKGFFLNLGLCVPVALGYCLAGYIGVFGDVAGIEEVLFLAILPTLYLPWKHHSHRNHRRGIGAAYAAPLGTFGIVFGLMIGVVMRYGFF